MSVDLPVWPRGWYVVARSDELRPGTVATRQLGSRELVLFRTESREVVALDAHCPHMGTHLRHATVVDGELECPMHGWRIDGTGQARRRGEACGRTSSAPVREAHGLVFVWLGPDHPGEEPAPAAPQQYRWRAGGPLLVAADWRALVVSSFDMDHLETVHRRRLLSAPEIASPQLGQLRLRYRSEAVGRATADRLTNWLSNGTIEVTMSCSGVLLVVTSALGRRRTAAVLGLLPTPTGVVAYGSFGMPRETWVPALQLRVATWLYLSFLRRDFAIIEGMKLRTDVADPGVRAMKAFLAGLPDECPSR